MSTFDGREKGYEAKYSHDREAEFRVIARRNKLLGQWAAAKLGLEGEAVNAYAREVIEADFEKPGDDDVVEKLMADFAAKSLDISEHSLRGYMERFLAEARAQIKAESG